MNMMAVPMYILYVQYNVSPENMHYVVHVGIHINTNRLMPAHRRTDVSFSSALLSWVYLQSSLTKMQTYREELLHRSHW